MRFIATTYIKTKRANFSLSAAENKQALELAKLKDTQALEQAILLHSAEKNRIEVERNLAVRILAKDSNAYCEAMGAFSLCEAVQSLGSSVEIGTPPA